MLYYIILLTYYLIYNCHGCNVSCRFCSATLIHGRYLSNDEQSENCFNDISEKIVSCNACKMYIKLKYMKSREETNFNIDKEVPFLIVVRRRCFRDRNILKHKMCMWDVTRSSEYVMRLGCVWEFTNSNVHKFKDIEKDLIEHAKSSLLPCQNCKSKMIGRNLIYDSCKKSEIITCINKCFSTWELINFETIVFTNGCLNDVNAYDFRPRASGLSDIKGFWGYEICNPIDKIMCNVADYNTSRRHAVPKEMRKIKNIQNIKMRICLACKTTRKYSSNATNCEMGLQSNKFNIVKCKTHCISKFNISDIMVNMERGCLSDYERHNISLSMNSNPKKTKEGHYECKDCFISCITRNYSCNNDVFKIPADHKIKPIVKVESMFTRNNKYGLKMMKINKIITDLIEVSSMINQEKKFYNIKYMKFEPSFEMFNDKKIINDVNLPEITWKKTMIKCIDKCAQSDNYFDSKGRTLKPIFGPTQMGETHIEDIERARLNKVKNDYLVQLRKDGTISMNKESKKHINAVKNMDIQKLDILLTKDSFSKKKESYQQNILDAKLKQIKDVQDLKIMDWSKLSTNIISDEKKVIDLRKDISNIKTGGKLKSSDLIKIEALEQQKTKLIEDITNKKTNLKSIETEIQTNAEQSLNEYKKINEKIEKIFIESKENIDFKTMVKKHDLVYRQKTVQKELESVKTKINSQKGEIPKDLVNQLKDYEATVEKISKEIDILETETKIKKSIYKIKTEPPKFVDFKRKSNMIADQIWISSLKPVNKKLDNKKSLWQRKSSLLRKLGTKLKLGPSKFGSKLNTMKLNLRKLSKFPKLTRTSRKILMGAGIYGAVVGLSIGAYQLFKPRQDKDTYLPEDSNDVTEDESNNDQDAFDYKNTSNYTQETTSYDGVRDTSTQETKSGIEQDLNKTKNSIQIKTTTQYTTQLIDSTTIVIMNGTFNLKRKEKMNKRKDELDFDSLLYYGALLVAIIVMLISMSFFYLYYNKNGSIDDESSISKNMKSGI